MNETLHTPFGTAKVYNNGYYIITSKKEGNNKKLLHRLIWEDFYGKPIPEGYSIHHKDGNPLNNEIWNLQCCEHSKHMRFHTNGKNHPMYDKNHSEETKRKISESLIGRTHSEECKKNQSKARNTTGYYRVHKHKDKKFKQGFTWVYQYYEEGKYKIISSVDIDKLEAKVKAKGLKWIKYINKELI